MEHTHLEGLAAISPELTLLLFSLTILVVDLTRFGREARIVGWLTIVGLAATAVQLIAAFDDPNQTVFGLVTVDRFGNFFKLFTVAAVAVVVFFVMNDRRERKRDIGEYFFLLTGAAIGIFFMVGTNNLLLLMLGLELLSLASYALAGFHKGEKRSAEAAMKYVVFGGLSAGMMLYGISLLYGLTGTLDLTVMASATGDGLPRSLAGAIQDSPAAVAVSIVLILAGFCYKVSVAPFHFWAPDVYEGAPTPVTTFLAVASKAAGFGALLRFIGVLFAAPATQEAVAAYGLQVGQLIAILAAVTMTLGNLAALNQDSVKRMLAYSSIAHAGYILMGVVAMSAAGFEAAMVYMGAYYFMNLGAFGFLLYFEGVTGKSTYESLKGMGWRAPVASIAMVAFLVSLTGLPPSVGFYGKYALFAACWADGFRWLVVVAALNSVVSLFYYMRVAKVLFLSQPSEKSAAPQPAMTGLLVVMAVLTVLFGVYATPLVRWCHASMDILG
ncbi:MAG: NADH-quinone oxidoreductase subunit N [Planctomycetota bacterium]